MNVYCHAVWQHGGVVYTVRYRSLSPKVSARYRVADPVSLVIEFILGLMVYFDESVNITINVLGNICNRFDCPASWPDLVHELVGALKAPQPLVQHRALLIFHHVVKALASKRLINDRRTFQVSYLLSYPITDVCCNDFFNLNKIYNYD